MADVPRRLMALGMGLCLLAGGAGLVGAGWMQLGHHRQLKANLASASAIVLDTRITPDKFRRSYDVRYHFRPTPLSAASPWVTHWDLLFDLDGRWTSVPKEVWEAARATGRIDVVYDRLDPRNNRPAATADDTLSLWGLIAVGAFIMLGGGIVLSASFRRREKLSITAAPVPSSPALLRPL